MKPRTQPITITHTLGAADPLEVRSGPSIVPTERLKLFSPSDWEGFVNEWVSSLPQYGLVERASGAGDMGCDVVATVTPSNPASAWDNFQCKHYDHALAPSDIWLELGKLCYYAYQGAYTLPRAYYFVAPRGVGTKLSRLLKKPADLKAGLMALWDEKCSTKLTDGQTIQLVGRFRDYVDAVDFSIFGYVPPLQLVEGHAKTRYFAIRFGLGLPARPQPIRPPDDIASGETRYVQQLMAAYSDHLQRPVVSPADLEPRLFRHLARAREWFYCAESLRNFSRDNLPDGAFENLQQQIYDGVVDLCEATTHACGLSRVDATTGRAALLGITSSALLGRFEIADRHGICHHLANEDRLNWVPADA